MGGLSLLILKLKLKWVRILHYNWSVTFIYIVTSKKFGSVVLHILVQTIFVSTTKIVLCPLTFKKAIKQHKNLHDYQGSRQSKGLYYCLCPRECYNLSFKCMNYGWKCPLIIIIIFNGVLQSPMRAEAVAKRCGRWVAAVVGWRPFAPAALAR